jgi:putative membrane protein
MTTEQPPKAVADASATSVVSGAGFQFIRGFLMGSADIVPGVSGGTVALILGIYRGLISNVRGGAHALKALVTGDIKGAIEQLKSVDWLFLVPLGAGVVAAFLALRHPMEDLLQNHSEGTAAVFTGLVLASCLLVWREITNRDALRLGALAVVAVAAFFLLGLQAGAMTGSVAICAMILPGISGSFIMLMFGMYAAVLGGSVGQLAVFLVGATIGLAIFSSLLNWLLDHYEQTVLASLLGLMIGSLRVLWPWPNGVGFISDEAEEVVRGTELALPDAGQLLGGVALAMAAAVVTLAIVKVAESTKSA